MEQVDKAHQKKLQAQKKLQDEQDKQQKKAERERVREEKAYREAAKKAEKQQKKQESDAAKAIQLPSRGKRKALSKPCTEPAAKKQRKRGATRVVVEASPSPAPPPVTTRSGRATRPNKKWEQGMHFNARDRDFVPTSHTPQLNATTTMEDALAELDALDSSEEVCYATIAKKHGVDRSTLSRKHQGVSGSRVEAGLARRNLQLEQEAELVKYIEGLTERKLPPTREMVQNYASDIAGHSVSESWVTRFLHRHQDELTSQ
ncbi:hypothetical protein EJ07DRAFT_173993 [Lizonia empirigonia]|nr:hypothetical protein EJ07DRAFT_173993 [Lizonia empirigonia]